MSSSYQVCSFTNDKLINPYIYINNLTIDYKLQMFATIQGQIMTLTYVCLWRNDYTPETYSALQDRLTLAGWKMDPEWVHILSYIFE